jgi:hypothetical protein
VALLPSLRRLSVTLARYSTASMAPLSRLSTLTFLALDGLHHFPPPASLAALTGLRHLRGIFRSPPTAEQLDAALRPLQQLTSLALQGTRHIPPAVCSLPQLQRLFLRDVSGEANAGLHPPLPLPHDLRSLRCLGIDWRVAAASGPALAVMPALEELWLTDAPDERSVSQQDWTAFWAWAARQPSLQRLHFSLPSGTASLSCVRVLARLWRHRPSLLVFVGEESFMSAYFAE